VVIDVVRFIAKYPQDVDAVNVITDNPILYRFVLPKPYFWPPSGEVTSQMFGENRADGYDLRNQAVLDRIAASRRKNASKTPAR